MTEQNTTLMTAPPPRAVAASPAGGELMMGSCPNLSAALASARDRCKGASKDAKNTHHGYKYASADEVIATASAALDGSGLCIVPIKEELTVVGSGNLAFYALHRLLVLSHSSGECTPLEVRGWPVIPERGRPLDKAYAIALTSSLAYKLRDLLQMPRGEQYDDVSAQNDHLTPVRAGLAQGPPPAGLPAASTAPPPPYQEPATAWAPASYPVKDPNAQAPAPTPALIDELTHQEYETLVNLAREHKRTQGQVSAICAAAGVPVLQKLPRSRLPWLRDAVIQGLAGADRIDRLTALIEELKLDWTKVRNQLQSDFQVSSLGHLLPSQADQVEERLKKVKLARQQASQQPAA